MPNSYEHSYQHDLDSIIDASDTVLAIGTEKVDTTTLKDRSLTGNDATIRGAMPSNGYFIGRRFTAANSNHLDCGNNSSLDFGTNSFTYVSIILPSTPQTTVVLGHGFSGVNPISSLGIRGSGRVLVAIEDDLGNSIDTTDDGVNMNDGSLHIIMCCVDRTLNIITRYVDGKQTGTIDNISHITGSVTSSDNLYIGAYNNKSLGFFEGEIISSYALNDCMPLNNFKSFVNSVARLPLYSHNFERYPNSDTSLTSVFPYTSGIITSGSFNKTDGLKCTSAGTIIFSNNFEFDGSEYITLVIDGVEYSGTTTVTQGTITATIAQGSNDITIDMGTNDVLEDVRIQFRSEV